MPARINATNQAPRLGSDEVLRIANEDAERKYGDVSDLEVSIRLHADGWHVDYRPANPEKQGDGPKYVIDAANGTIKSKKYYQ